MQVDSIFEVTVAPTANVGFNIDVKYCFKRIVNDVASKCDAALHLDFDY